MTDQTHRRRRELQRIAMQDNLDATARREERLAVVTGADQVARTRAEPGHTRRLLLVLSIDATGVNMIPPVCAPRTPRAGR